MDPIAATIVAGVIWLFGGSILTVIWWVLVISILAVTLGEDHPVAAGIAIFFGWLVAVAWEGFVIIQVIIHVVHLVQLIIAGSA